MSENGKNFSVPDSGFDRIIKSISKKPESGQERKLVAFDESLTLAKDLWEQYRDKILANSCKDVDGWGQPYTDYQKSIEHFLKEQPEEMLKRFSAHGITRKSSLDQLAGALNILANKSIKGWYGPLGGESYGYGAYKNGDFIVISRIDKSLSVAEEADGKRQVVSNEIGWVADIGAFVVDTKYYPLVDELKNRFPDVNIIKANQLSEYLQNK